MKYYLVLYSAMLFCLSCTGIKAQQSTEWQQKARSEYADDATLNNLQLNNELLLVFSIETHAWGTSATYKVLALNHGEWTGYTWYVRKAPGVAAVPNVNPLIVNNDSCNAVWKYLQQKKVWNIPSDNGENFCTTNNNCNINDGSTWKLSIIANDKIVDPAYYEPPFYEECCPGNKDRALFIAAINKLTSVMGNGR